MKKKLGIRTLAVILAASVVMSASTGLVSAKNGAGVSATGDVSDTSAVSETTSRASAKSVSSTGISIEGAALKGVKIPTGLSGAGTEKSPYRIGSLDDLRLMNSYINYEGADSKEFVLAKDIDLSKATFSDFTESDGIWSLVSAKASLSGNADVYFHLNGNGHKLYGLNLAVSKNVSTGAIFGYVNANSVIENLTVESCTLRVNRAQDGAYAVLCVQNCGTIRNCTLTDCVLDARLANVAERAAGDGFVSDLIENRVCVGHALGVADNNGKVMNFTVSGSDTNKGVFVKGARRYVGIVAGQNRKQIVDATVSGMRIVSYGSEDGDASVSGKGLTAASVGVVAGRNEKSASVLSAKVTLKNGSDILFGSPVGGVVGENDGSIEDSMVTGTNAAYKSVSAASANLYSCGVCGAVAGSSSGIIRASGAYNIGFAFARDDAENAYGGVAGSNSGSILNCAASGSVNAQSAASAGVGGLVGYVQTGTSLLGNYAIVSVSGQGANTGALIGKDGTDVYIGKTNYWSSNASGLASSAPNSEDGQGDLAANTPAIILTESTSGVTLSASALAFAWAGSSAVAAADLTRDVTVSNQLIRLNQSANSVTLSCTNEGVVGALSYYVSIDVPAGIAGQKLSARVSLPIFVTASSASGAGSSAKNPIVISDASQMQIMQYAPNAHYKLKTDITLGSDWTPIDFTGTLDGSEHTLRISRPLFKSVSGRSGVSAASLRNASGAVSGYIHNLTIIPTDCVSGGVFGDVQNAVLRDVTYTVADENDGFVALSAPRSGALIDTLSGSAYLLRCKVSVPIAVTVSEAEGIGALVGYAYAADLIAESCETASLMSLEQNASNVGGLFGNIASVIGAAELIDCCATGCVYVSSAESDVRARIMVGAAADGVAARGCTYVVSAGVSGGSVAKEAAPFANGITALNPQGEEARQSAEDARAMLELIDPERIDEDDLTGLSLDGGIYKLYDRQDMLDMMTKLNDSNVSDADRQAVYELQNDIDMTNTNNGAKTELKMSSTSAAKAFAGTFRSASGHKYTLSNFTVTGTTNGTNTYSASGSNSYNNLYNYISATALFCYANGATFQDIALEGATVTNIGMGTAVLVGYADKSGTAGTDTTAGSNTACTFTNIDITDCNVYSLKSISGTVYSVANACQAGTLIGAVWSGKTGNLYNIKGIKVTNCTVENRNWDSGWTPYYSDVPKIGSTKYHTGGGAWSLGGLIGESRLRASTAANTGTLCIGGANTEDAVVLENVTVTGYGFVGGVIGKAGNPALSGVSGTISSTNAAKYVGGVSIQNVTVKSSAISAGNGSGQGGCCAGILAAEIVKVGGASIEDCTVTDTTITSNNNLSSVSNVFSECAGIAAHMSGLVEDCTVEHCTISSCTAGGIVCRSSRKSVTAYGATGATVLTINRCKVIGNVNGNTTITVPDNFSYTTGGYMAGGILTAALDANARITNCGVGSGAGISGRFTYAGGFVGYTSDVSAVGYSTVIANSVTEASVEITASVADSAAAGAVAYAGLEPVADADGTTDANLVVDSCVVGGNVKNVAYHCGGVYGISQDAGTSENRKVFQIRNCAITAVLDASATNRARLLAYSSGDNGTLSNNAATSWCGNIEKAVRGVIISSHPHNVACFGAWSGGQLSAQASNLSDVSILAASVTISSTTYDCVEDINKPDNTNYIHGSASAVVIDGVRDASISITNQTSYASGGAGARLSITATTADWISTAPDYFTVDSITASPLSVNVKAWQDTNDPDAGVEALYTIVGFTRPGTVSDPMQIKAFIPVTTSNTPISGSVLIGNGSPGSPYQIPDLSALNQLRTKDLSLGQYYVLTGDIDLGASGFDPIVGQSGTIFNGDFSGTYEGVTHMIYGTINSSSSIAEYVGVFARTNNNANIHDLKLSVTVTSTGSADYVGTAVGKAESTAFSNISLEDHLSDPSDPTSNVVHCTVTGSGLYTGGLAGKAESCTFTGVSVTGATIGGANTNTPSAYAGALAAYATDASAVNTTLTNVTVQHAYFTGGVFGHAHYTGNNTNTVLGTSISGLTVASAELSTATLYDGTNSGKLDAAGGIAAEFAGTIGSSTGGTGRATTIQTLAATGSNAGGVVGFVDQTHASAVTCSISNVTISGTTAVTSSRTLSGGTAKAAAGGIIGKVRTSDSENSPAVTLTVSGCTLNSGVTVSGVLYAGGVLGNSGLADGTITISDCTTFATVSATGSSGATAGGIAGRVYDLRHIWIDLCVASGSLSALTNAGGVIGLADGDVLNADFMVQNADLTSHGLITNTVFSAGSVTAANKGVLIGSVAAAILPETGLTNSPFVNIYYSGRQVGSMHVTGDGVDADVYAGYLTTYVDLQANFRFVDVSSTASTVITFMGSNSLQLTSSNLHWTGVNGRNFWEFTCTDNVPFVLNTIDTENEADLINFEFHETSGTRDGATITVRNEGTGTVVFRYTNGIELEMTIDTTSMKGNGSQDSPYLIERISHLGKIAQDPTAYYALAQDLDFAHATQNANGSAKTQAEKDWASNWSSWAAGLSAAANGAFSGHLDGMWYPYDENSPSDPYPSTDNNDDPIAKVQHKIIGLTVTANSDTAVGFFPKLHANAVVSNLIFRTCSFTSTNANSNVGTLTGENEGKITNVSVDNCTVSGGKHVGAIAGLSYTAISGTAFSGSMAALADLTSGSFVSLNAGTGLYETNFGTISGHCCVINSSVTSLHCAGGVVGGDVSGVSNALVFNTTVSGALQAGGITGGTLRFVNNNENTEVPTDWMSGLLSCTFTHCAVVSVAVNANSALSGTSGAAGGILGEAEQGISGRYRSITIDHCTVDATTTVQANNQNASGKTGYAGGVLGLMSAYYNGFVVETCQSYADVKAYGAVPNTNNYTAASALVGEVLSNQNYILNDNNVSTFRFVNNVCSGTISTTRIAGGVCGYFGAYSVSASDRIQASASPVFACGNIISAKFAYLAVGITNANFGVFMGSLCSDAFDGTSAQIANTMTDNYYSSYVCKVVTTDVSRFGTGVVNNEVNACAGLLDVAFRTSENAETSDSSLHVRSYGFKKNVVIGSNPTRYTYSLRSGQKDQTVIISVDPNPDNVYSSLWYPTTALDLQAELKFYVHDGATGNAVTTKDLATYSNAVTVYNPANAPIDVADRHMLMLQNISVDPVNSSYYSVEGNVVSNKYRASLTIVTDPRPSRSQPHKLVADLGYGLLVGISMILDESGNGTGSGTGSGDTGSGDTGSGVDDEPTYNSSNIYHITNEYEFAHYFFGQHTTDYPATYKSFDYSQDVDIDFAVVEHDYLGKTLNNFVNPSNPGVTIPSETFASFTPIGSETISGAQDPFTGVYNGNNHKITNFHYEGGATEKDVGLFGYVSQPGKLENLHIELRETVLNSDLVGANGASAAVSGGLNTGGLVGKYTSTKNISNCSVVYGTVRCSDTIVTGSNPSYLNSDGGMNNVGGLVGYMYSPAKILNCFTSTSVSAPMKDPLNHIFNSNVNCGGLVGLHNAGAADNNEYNGIYENCFCSSDVSAPFYVSGFVGRVHGAPEVQGQTTIVLRNCICTATVTALYQAKLKFNNSVGSTEPVSLVVGYWVRGIEKDSYVQANHVVVSGMNTTEFNSKSDTKYYYPVLFGQSALKDESADIYYDADAIGRIMIPYANDNNSTPYIRKVDGTLWQSDLLSEYAGDGEPAACACIQTMDTAALLNEIEALSKENVSETQNYLDNDGEPVDFDSIFMDFLVGIGKNIMNDPDLDDVYWWVKSSELDAETGKYTSTLVGPMQVGDSNIYNIMQRTLVSDSLNVMGVPTRNLVWGDITRYVDGEGNSYTIRDKGNDIYALIQQTGEEVCRATFSNNGTSDDATDDYWTVVSINNGQTETVSSSDSFAYILMNFMVGLNTPTVTDSNEKLWWVLSSEQNADTEKYDSVVIAPVEIDSNTYIVMQRSLVSDTLDGGIPSENLTWGSATTYLDEAGIPYSIEYKGSDSYALIKQTGEEVRTVTFSDHGTNDDNNDDYWTVQYKRDNNIWVTSNEDLYPYLLSRQTTQDNYFNTFSKLSSLPVHIDAREADDGVQGDRAYSGITFPTTIDTTLDRNKLEIQSSTYSSGTATSYAVAPYSSYDQNLWGNDVNDTDHDRGQMDTDFLFSKAETGKFTLLRNTYLTSVDQTNATNYNAVQYDRNERAPYVRVALKELNDNNTPDDTSDDTYDEVLHRNIRIGLRGSGTVSYVSTERQLRAISAEESAGTKFYKAYHDTVEESRDSKNIRLCADIDMSDDDFTPIPYFQVGLSWGDFFEGAFGFDGSGCEIRNLHVSEPGGLFGEITSGSPKISNLILRDPDIATMAGNNGALVGSISAGNTGTVSIQNCMVIGGSITGGNVGGLVGSLENNGSNSEVKNVGVVGVQISGGNSGTASSAGLVFGTVKIKSIENVYAVGEVKTSVTGSASGVGGLAGVYTGSSGSTVSKVVTSGYVQNTAVTGNVGGVFGYMNANAAADKLEKAESTAFVRGGSSANVGGLVGDVNIGTIDKSIFAGGIDGGASGKAGCICGNYHAADSPVSNVRYDRSLQTKESTNDDAANARTTSQLVRGNNASNTDEKSTFTGFAYDDSESYYPNPIDSESSPLDPGVDLAHTIPDEFFAGLNFALARIDFNDGSKSGSATRYTNITATSPIGTNENDTVALTEVTAANEAIGSDGTAYLQNAQTDTTTLEPNLYLTDAYTGVRATLSGEPGASFAGESSIYRFLLVGLVQVVNVEYIVNTSSATNFPSVNDKLVLMLQTKNGSNVFTSNAITSSLQDSDSGDTVQFASILTSSNDPKVYVDMLLPKGYKFNPDGATAYLLGANGTVNTGAGNKFLADELCFDVSLSSQGEQQEQTPTASSAHINVQLTVPVVDDYGWGIRDLNGGI